MNFQEQAGEPQQQSEIIRDIESAYQGEVFGIAMYTQMVEQLVTPLHRWKFQVLLQLEHETIAPLRELLEQLGGDTRELPLSREQGQAEARRLAPMEWHELIWDFMSDLPSLIKLYGDLEKRAAASGLVAPALRQLVLHEEVTLAFCEAEMQGSEATAIDPVLALLRRPPARP